VKSRLQKYIDYTGEMRYVDVLQDVVRAYNSSIHSSIGMAPVTVTHDDRDAIEYYAYLNDRNPRLWPKAYGLKRGDTVVISKLRGTFRREYDEEYSHEIYRIKVGTNGRGYQSMSLMSMTAHPSKAPFTKKNCNT